jgi:hypothetical protein
MVAIPIWYIATPYSKFTAGIDAAYDEACKIRARFAEERIPAYCPVAELHGVARFVTQADPRDSQFWQTVCNPIMRLCYGMAYVALPGHAESDGMAAERAWFNSIGHPIVYLDPADLAPGIGIIKSVRIGEG